MELAGKRVFLTGASSGIGRELARRLIQKGAQVALAARRGERLAELRAELGDKSLALTMDVTKRASVESAVTAAAEQFGGLDVLVNDAGVGYFGPLATMSEQDMDLLLATNVRGPLFCAQCALPHLRESHGTILNISSGLSKRALPFLSFYGGTKSMLDALSDGLRMELRATGVSVFNFCPPETETDFDRNSRIGQGFARGATQRSRVPLRPVVDHILGALEKGKRETLYRSAALKHLNYFFPKLLDRLFYKAMVERLSP